MNLENETIYIIVGIIAIVVVISVCLAKKIGLKVDKESLSFFASKQDNVTVEDIEKSKVDIENRDRQDVSVKKVSDNSDVKIK